MLLGFYKKETNFIFNSADWESLIPFMHTPVGVYGRICSVASWVKVKSIRISRGYSDVLWPELNR